VVTLVIPPRWEGDSRVMLNLLKPDPVTDQVVGGPSSRSYIASQISLITDYSVASRVVDDLGWLADPNLIQQYQGRSSDDTRDFRHWAAQLIMDRTKVEITEGSNILDIKYRGTTPESARTVADAVRKSYLDTSVALRRADANKDADWFDAQALKAKVALNAA